MKQVLQELGTGRTFVEEVPAPGTPRSGLRIITRRSLISAGTERMLVEFGRAGLVDKIRKQPEHARRVLEKARTDGVLVTLEAVRTKLDQTLALGYCNVGVVASAGATVSGFKAGDRVVSNGPHAEVVAVPSNLCARIPDGVSDEAAAFTVLGAIGLQGMRLAGPTLGETFVVIGLGLIGLVTVQLLRANGCRVLGLDLDPAKTALARRFGAEAVELSAGADPLAAATAFSRGRGVDGVLITAATTSNEPVAHAARMCRKRGRIVLVGVTGLQLDRADFYEKELSFQVSCSYGPGRYDPSYEDEGHDYPVGFVRWTEQRNFEAVLDMLAAGTLDVTPLITHRFALGEAERAYDLLTNGSEPYLGILLEYAEQAADSEPTRSVSLHARPASSAAVAEAPAVAVIGAGNYASRVLLPALKASGARLLGIASSRGVSATQFGRKFGFEEATTEAGRLITDPRVNAVVVATRHDSHASFVTQALAAGKHVFVEKPLAISAPEIDEVERTWQAANVAGRHPLLMVGFNRRFAPQVVRMKSLLDTVKAPKTFIITVNAGMLPANHWTQLLHVGGGRIIGEACHFIDLLRFLADAPFESWQIASVGSKGGEIGSDKSTLTLSFENGSIGTVHYFANGHASFPKERIEVFCAGRILQLDNFRQLRGYGWKGFTRMNLWRQDKGQAACAAAFVRAIREGLDAPIPFEQVMEVSRVTVALGEAAQR